jgi:hypothetical protein
MPARLPDRVKELRGTLRESRKNERAPRLPAAKIPAPPRELTVKERRVWLRLAKEVPPGVYTAADYTAFLLLVRSVATAENPPVAMKDSARIHWARMAAAMLARFGLDPASREKVSVAGKDADLTDGEDELTAPGLRVVD